MLPDLITLEDLKISMRIPDTDTDRDAQLSKAITLASASIRSFTDRSFGAPIKKGVKIYEYDSSGFLDIDDAMAIENVEFVFGGLKTPITNFYWRAEPQAGPPYSYIVIPVWAGIYSPQMGFKYNLDVISRDRGWPGLIPVVEVTAKFGWPEVPDDVEQAAIWTAARFSEKPDALISESIANYSYTTQLRGGGGFGGPLGAIPSEAQDILASYIRFLV